VTFESCRFTGFRHTFVNTQREYNSSGAYALIFKLRDTPEIRSYLFISLLTIFSTIFVLSNTTFRGVQEVEDAAPKSLDLSAYVKEQLPKITQEISETAIEMSVISSSISEKGVVETGKELGRDLGNNSFVFPVKATAKVVSFDENFIVLEIAGSAEGDVFNIPIGLALSGNPIRDVTGKIKFGDFFDQTEYQAAANAFKDLIRESIITKLDPPSLVGKTITVYGAWNNGPIEKIYNIIPTSITISEVVNE
jgi:predicted lipoprotein